MVSHQVVYQLGLFALIGLSLVSRLSIHLDFIESVTTSDERNGAAFPVAHFCKNASNIVFQQVA